MPSIIIDFEQYDLAPEAIAYCQQDDLDAKAFDAGYFERVISKLADSKLGGGIAT